MSRLYILFLTLALSFMPNASRAGEDDLTMRINQGNESFLSGKFNDAIKTYESIRADGFQNGYLSYNLGNAYFRVGNKGKAILNYLEAQSLLPREEEIRANLEFAIRKTEDRLAPEKENIVTSLLFWINDLSFKEHIHLALALHGLFWLAMILLYYRPTSAVDFTRKAVLGLFMLSICGLGARYYFNESKLKGVVLENAIQVVSGPETSAKTLFELHEGAIVYTEKQGEWCKIELDSGKTGWTHAKNIGFLEL